jgi:lipopolysaccharide biosynthesis regulator YciM
MELPLLHDKAEAIVRDEIILPEHHAAVEEYERLSGANPSRVSDNENSIKSAAEQGRVDKLLAAMIRKTADTVRDTSEEVLQITFPGQEEANRALNILAQQVWRMSGRVLTLQPQEMPAGRTMVARLRY